MKKSNKGFTMVELLAVVTIMGILAVIAVPAVARHISKSRQTSLDTMLKSSYEAAENYMMQNDVLLHSGDPDYVIQIKDLVDKNYLEPLIDPAGNSSRCDTNSNSKVTVSYDSTTGGIVSYKFKVKIVCPTQTLEKTFPE